MYEFQSQTSVRFDGVGGGGGGGSGPRTLLRDPPLLNWMNELVFLLVI